MTIKEENIKTKQEESRKAGNPGIEYCLFPSFVILYIFLVMLQISILLDAFEPASGGVWFQKLRGATQVHHAAKSVNQCIVPKDAIANFSRKWRGRRAHYHQNNENPATFVGFALLRKNLMITFN